MIDLENEKAYPKGMPERMDCMAPREVFEKELTELQNQIEDMSRMVRETYKELLDAFENKDKDAILEIINSDKLFYVRKK